MAAPVLRPHHSDALEIQRLERTWNETDWCATRANQYDFI